MSTDTLSSRVGKAFALERHSIDFIPESERHGRPSNQLTMWFAANVNIVTAITGGLAVVFGLPLLWALVALFVGNLIGTAIMALHSVQGPRLGIEQMIQSRAQFGYYGATIALLLGIVVD